MSESTSLPKLATERSRSRRQTSLRLLRMREAAGVSREDLGRRVAVTGRAIGSIERAEVRCTALEAFFFLFDRVIATQGLEAALSAILLPSHMAVEAVAAVDRAAAKSSSNLAEGADPRVEAPKRAA